MSKQIDPVEHPFRCVTAIQMRFNDIDMLGHLNNTSYFEMFDLGKNDYFTKVKRGYIEWSKPALMIVHMSIDFVSQTRFSERVEVRSQVTRLGDKSVHMTQHLVNADTGEVKCQCHSVLCYFNIETGIPAPISQEWRDDIARFEGRTL